MSWCHISGITQQVLVTVMDELRQLQHASPRLSAPPVWGLWRGSADVRARHLSLCLGCWHEASLRGFLPTLVSQEKHEIEEMLLLLGQNPGNKHIFFSGHYHLISGGIRGCRDYQRKASAN